MLEYLNLSHNRIKNLDDIGNLHRIKKLNIENNLVEDISKLSNLTNVSYLYLTNNNIKDFKALENLENLSELKVQGNPDINTNILNQLLLNRYEDNKNRNPFSRNKLLIDMDLDCDGVIDRYDADPRDSRIQTYSQLERDEER